MIFWSWEHFDPHLRNWRPWWHWCFAAKKNSCLWLIPGRSLHSCCWPHSLLSSCQTHAFMLFGKQTFDLNVALAVTHESLSSSLLDCCSFALSHLIVSFQCWGTLVVSMVSNRAVEHSVVCPCYPSCPVSSSLTYRYCYFERPQLTEMTFCLSKVTRPATKKLSAHWSE